MHVLTLLFVTYISPGIALLRKYLSCLVECLPDDHFVTLSTLSSIIQVQDSFFDEVLSCTNSKKANKKILSSLIMMLRDDTAITGFSSVLRDIMGSKSPSLKFLEFQLGINIDCTFL